MKFSHRLATMRFDIGIKQGRAVSMHYLAKHSGVSRTMLIGLEKGERGPGLTTLVRLGRFCMKHNYDPVGLYRSAGLSFERERRKR